MAAKALRALTKTVPGGTVEGMTSTPETLTDSQQYRDAVALANQAAESYYDSETVLMDDAAYDVLARRIKAAEAAHPDWTLPESPSLRVGAGGGDVVHVEKMLSLDNVFSRDELAEFVAAAERKAGSALTWVVEPKLDGLAVAATYQAGRLVRLATRGDGSTGEDVTFAAQAIVGLPAMLGTALDAEVRGEVVLTHAQLDKANEQRRAHGDNPFVNARNGAAGALRGRDRAYRIELTFHAYGAVGLDTTSHSDTLETLQAAGIRTTAQAPGSITRAHGIEQLWAAVDSLHTQRPDLGIDIDGAVIKIDDSKTRNLIGSTARAPRWAIAYKYPADTVLSVLQEVIWQVGRTGVITPRARITPVSVGGVTVTYATLHNPDDVSRKGFMIGDTVSVHRAGDVIPRLEAPLVERRDGTQTPVVNPAVCPRCHGDIDRSQARWRCVRGRACGAAESVRYAASRDALDIDGMGDTLVRQLVELGHVSDAGDLFTLTREQLMDCERMGDTSADKLLANIAAAKSAELHRVYTALGMRDTGRTICRRLARRFTSWSDLAAASVEDLCTVEGIGPDTAEVIAAEIADVAPIVTKMLHAGVVLQAAAPAAASSGQPGALAGLKVCVSGSVPGLTRTEAQEKVEALGGTAVSSVSKNTDLLVAGDGAGSKLDKAASLGVRVMSAQEFADLGA